jgi:predicted transposase YbfD/YdcC
VRLPWGREARAIALKSRGKVRYRLASCWGRIVNIGLRRSVVVPKIGRDVTDSFNTRPGITMANSSHPLSQLHARIEALTDPRVVRQQRHLFSEVVVLGIVGFLANCNDWVAVERFGKARLDWLKTFLSLPNGIPSHDTIGRIFAVLDPEEFVSVWECWMREVCERLGLKQVAVDGKTMCGSKSAGRKALHIVTAFATANGVSLSQEVVDEKSNEIPAIPELLKRLDISGALVSSDAMGCQTEIAHQIREQKADYLLAVKGNQPKLLAAIETYTSSALEKNYDGVNHDFYETNERSHGRDETRSCYVFPASDVGVPEGWRDLKSVVMVVSERGEKDESVSEVRYYISSREASAKALLEGTRNHWKVENHLHWQLDITFGDDDSRLQEGHGPANAAWVKRIAASMLKNATVGKEKWMSGKRQFAALDPNILESIIQQFLEN